MKNVLISGAADILAGLAALALFVVADIYLHVGADLREGLIVLAVLGIAAGLLRGSGRPRNTWWKGLLVGSGASVVLLVLGWQQIQPVILTLLLVTANLSIVCGVHARRLFAARAAARGGIIVLLSLGALTVAAMGALPSLMTRLAIQREFAPAPVYSIRTAAGADIGSADLRGRVVVLTFWATWCPACRRELPEIDKLYRRYRGNANVAFWALDGLKNGDTAEQAAEFMRKAGYALPIAFYPESLAAAFGVKGLPALIVIDSSSRVRLVHTGYDSSERLQGELSREIEALLGERS